MVASFLENRFPETQFQFINAGISSTCSTTESRFSRWSFRRSSFPCLCWKRKEAVFGTPPSSRSSPGNGRTNAAAPRQFELASWWEAAVATAGSTERGASSYLASNIINLISTYTHAYSFRTASQDCGFCSRNFHSCARCVSDYQITKYLVQCD